MILVSFLNAVPGAGAPSKKRTLESKSKVVPIGTVCGLLGLGNPVACVLRIATDADVTSPKIDKVSRTVGLPSRPRRIRILLNIGSELILGNKEKGKRSRGVGRILGFDLERLAVRCSTSYASVGQWAS